jgi:hypothetical protein
MRRARQRRAEAPAFIDPRRLGEERVEGACADVGRESHAARARAPVPMCAVIVAAVGARQRAFAARHGAALRLC